MPPVHTMYFRQIHPPLLLYPYPPITFPIQLKRALFLDGLIPPSTTCVCMGISLSAGV